EWKGTDADLALLDDLAYPGYLYVDLKHVDAAAIGGLKPKHPFESLYLQNASDESLAKMPRLPACKGFGLGECKLSPKGWQRLVALTRGLESLQISGPDRAPGQAAPPQGVPSAAFEYLAQIRSLKTLALMRMASAGITGAGLN